MEHPTLLVLGGDGYLGSPLALRLARLHPERRIVLADNLLRRRLVQREGSSSLLPLADPARRLKAARRIHGLSNLEFVELDATTSQLDALIRRRRPHVIYHLAQQGSAPYSMRGCDEALFTLSNNEYGNMRLLWAVRRYVPDCHIVKLGSFGEYAKSGMDIAVACRTWGLRVTDIMQSTIFGTWSEEIANHEELFTRLDYDECFGTVVNRYLAQALAGLPLMVYGSGHQRTGLMSLQDSIQSLAELADHAPVAGTHRVINHVTEESYSINELGHPAGAIPSRTSRQPADPVRGIRLGSLPQRTLSLLGDQPESRNLRYAIPRRARGDAAVSGRRPLGPAARAVPARTRGAPPRRGHRHAHLARGRTFAARARRRFDLHQPAGAGAGTPVRASRPTTARVDDAARAHRRTRRWSCTQGSERTTSANAARPWRSTSRSSCTASSRDGASHTTLADRLPATGARPGWSWRPSRSSTRIPCTARWTTTCCT